MSNNGNSVVRMVRDACELDQRLVCRKESFSISLGVLGKLVLLCCQLWPGTDHLVHLRRLGAASHEGPAETAETSIPVSQMDMVVHKTAAGQQSLIKT